MQFRTSLATSVALLSLGYTLQVAAQPMELDELVVSAAGYEQKVTDAPASISVLSQQDLQQSQFSNLAEALDTVEGVDIRQSTGKTGGLNISIRGLPSEYTLILIDGRRQNPPGNVTPNGFGDTSTSFMPPLSAIERIEVIRGPMSTLYGSDAIGGVVNIITKKVSDEWVGSVTLEHTFQEDRDFGDTGKTSFYTSGPLIENVLGLSVRGSVYDREAANLEFENGSAAPKRGVAPVDGRNHTVGARLTFEPAQGHEFYLDAEQGKQVYNNDACQLGTLDGKSRSCEDKPGVANGYGDELRFNREQVVLGHSSKLGFGTWSNDLSYNVTETEGRTLPGTIGKAYDAPYQALVGGADRELESKDTIFDTKLVAPVTDSQIVTLGAQYRDTELTDGIANTTFEQNSWAVFAEDEWYLRDDLALTLGGRYEDHDAFSGHFTPRAYLVWNSSANWTLKGGVSKGYKTPDINDLHNGVNGVTKQGEKLTIGTPDLEPEKSTNYELGAYFDNLNGFKANATVFYTRFSDKIDRGNPVTITGDSLIPDGTYDQLANIGKAETRGVELASNWEFAPAWTLRSSYTYTDTEQKSGVNKGAPLTNTPEHVLHARLNWQATSQLNLWLSGEYRGERTRYVSLKENLSAEETAIYQQLGDLSDYALFHLGGSYQASENLKLTATIYNVFNKDFLEGSSYTFVDNNGNEVTDWASEYIYVNRGMAAGGMVEEGRRLWLSANVTF
ncbi:TonB-dependent receptor domain-containing protein [Marinobacter litoralis]|uniref:TonB-dependent receptor domain-containing protein n=1 Tax=Marinobacter litoralis TaxID=187981 RepID=UPI0018ED0334|nr:TonB-dependent receptor [Marinobacter litoralis]MBJ6136349.1 TonB-dependent receptor [Marinobacter litoralis]